MSNIPLIETLIRLKTIPENPDQLQEALDVVERELSEYSIQHFESNAVKSILVSNTDGKSKDFKLILNCHLDVIPGQNEQYEPTIEEDHLKGVGAMDMKANLVCAIEAFKRTASKISYPLALQIVTDEEIGGFNGTLHQINSGVSADFVLSTEPTNFDVVHRAKGVLQLEISTKGKTAHGAYPWRGVNAIELMSEAFSILNTVVINPVEESWATTMNIASITTDNIAFNKVPDTCMARVDIRFIPEEGEVVFQQIQNLLSDICSIKVVANEPSLDSDIKSKYIQTLATITERNIGKTVVFRAAQGTSDARHYRHINVDGIEFGPIGGNIGGDNEWVSISSLDTYQKILEDYILELDT